MPLAVELRSPRVSEVGELLTLQRAAYVSEAQLYDDPRLPALVQTLDELVAELSVSTCIGAWSGGRMVGAVRSREEAGILHIGRLVVAPDLQGLGIGQRLLAAVEGGTRLPVATLFTGARSEANLRLYRRLGYEERSRELLRPGLQLVHLVKSLGGPQR